MLIQKENLKMEEEILQKKIERALAESLLWIIIGIIFSFNFDLKTVIIWLLIILHIINQDWGGKQKKGGTYYQFKKTFKIKW